MEAVSKVQKSVTVATSAIISITRLARPAVAQASVSLCILAREMTFNTQGNSCHCACHQES